MNGVAYKKAFVISIVVVIALLVIAFGVFLIEAASTPKMMPAQPLTDEQKKQMVQDYAATVTAQPASVQENIVNSYTPPQSTTTPAQKAAIAREYSQQGN